jgi:hypothetical protein
MRVRGRSPTTIRPLDGIRISSIMSIIVSPRRPRKRRKSIVSATGPICAKGAILPSEISASPTNMTTCPTSWTFGVYFRRRTLQFGPHQRADAGMAGVPRRKFRRLLDPNLIGARSSSIRRASSPIPTRPKSGFPELPYVTLRLAYMACEYFNADYRAGHRASRASGVLSPRVPARDHRRAAIVPGLLKPVGLMAADFRRCGKGFERYP